MVESDNLRFTRMALNNGSAIPALGFGTLIPDPIATKNATKAALEAGFRQLDASERYRNEKEVGEAMQEVFKAGKIKREEGAIPKSGDFDSSIRSLPGTTCDKMVEDPRSAFNFAGKIHLPTTV